MIFGSLSAADARPHYTTFLIGGVSAYPLAVNANGYIAGFSGVNGFLRAPDGTAVTFDPDGAQSVQAWGLNNSNEITGYYQTSIQHGFVRTADGTITTFDPEGSTTTYALGINDQGAVTGFWFDSGGKGHGFIRAADGSITSFDAPGATFTGSTSINSKGAVTGWWNPGIQGFVRTAGGRFTSFDCPGASMTIGTGIDRAGAIAGYCFFNDGFHGFLRSADGTITTFDPPDNRYGTQTQGINDRGAITGTYRDAKGQTRGFVRSHAGTIVEFHLRGYVTQPTAINDAGAIVGSAYKHRINYGFLRTR